MLGILNNRNVRLENLVNGWCLRTYLVTRLWKFAPHGNLALKRMKINLKRQVVTDSRNGKM